jgi:ABC-type uncharacterized transport system substrate-binding protein
MWTFASNSHAGFVFLIAGICMCLFAASAQSAEGAVNLSAVEWIPLGSHDVIVEALIKGCRDRNVQVNVQRYSAFGDAAQFAAIGEKLKNTPNTAIIAFEDHACRQILQACPGIPVVALLTRGISISDSRASSGFHIVDGEATPASIMKVAGCLQPGLRTLGVLYSRGYAPNEALAEHLRGEAQKEGRATSNIVIDTGFCRTDHDFRTAIENALHEMRFEILYVPSDPNSSRFGATICSTATALNIPVIGSEAIAGKGCALTIELDHKAIGTRAAEIVCTGVFKSSNGVIAVPPKVLPDDEVLRRFGLTFPTKSTVMSSEGG